MVPSKKRSGNGSRLVRFRRALRPNKVPSLRKTAEIHALCQRQRIQPIVRFVVIEAGRHAVEIPETQHSGE